MYKVERLSNKDRNKPCFCGSGIKTKKCCWNNIPQVSKDTKKTYHVYDVESTCGFRVLFNTDEPHIMKARALWEKVNNKSVMYIEKTGKTFEMSDNELAKKAYDENAEVRNDNDYASLISF